MKWLKLDYIKQHSRIDYDCEDALLEVYANAAEETLLNVLHRTYDEVVSEFGTTSQPFPAALMMASLQLVEVSYAHRSPVSMNNLYYVPYTFDMIVKPYMKLGFD